jgi:predicted Zn-dependent peptidase
MVKIAYTVYDDIEFLSNQWIAIIYFQHMFLNFETGIFYKRLRDEHGIIYSINMAKDINLYNSKSSYYKINTQTNKKNVRLFFKTMTEILSNLQFTKEDVEWARKSIFVEYQYKTFKYLASENSHYLRFLMSKNKIVKKEEIVDQLVKIDFEDLKKEIHKISKSLLEKSIVFYYSNENLKRQINLNKPYHVF